jgi:hypothetical protein
MEHRSAQAMPAFTTVELGQRCAAPIFSINVSQTMQSFVNPAEFCQGLGQPDKIIQRGICDLYSASKNVRTSHQAVMRRSRMVNNFL